MKFKTIYLGLLVIALIGFSCEQAKRENKENTQNPEEVTDTTVFSVKVEKIKYSSFEKTEPYSANIKAWDEANIGPAAPNQIEKIFVEVGDRVKKGDLLAQMDQTSLIQAKIQFEDTKRDFERMDTLITYGSISQQIYDKTKMGYELAKTALKTLEENVNLYAPFNGIITGKYYNDGEIYSSMTPNPLTGVPCIVTLMQIDELKVFINVSEKYWPLVKKGMGATLLCDIYPNEVFPGEVYKVYPTINPSTKTFQVEIKIPNYDEKLRPGMYAKAELYFGKKESLIVPVSAVLKQEGTNDRYVFIEKDGKALKRIIKLGKRFDEKVEIISGIEIGENLIIAGQAKLLDGNSVKIVND